VVTEQRLVTTYLAPDLLERAQSWGLIFVTLGVGIFLACLGAWLFLKPGTKEIVKVEMPPAQVVRVEVPTAAPAPPPIDMSQYVRKDQLPTQTSTGEAIKRQVTLFASAAHANGEVVSGWIFKDGAAGSTPLNEYCYYGTDPVNNSPTTRVNLALNGTEIPFDQSAVPDHEAALQKCQWFDRTATKRTSEAPSVNRITPTHVTSQDYAPQTTITPLIPAETTAANEVRNFVEQWSDPRVSIYAIGNHYGASVFYFGTQTNHEDIIADMQRNAQRWPYRRYAIYQDQLTTTCNLPGVGGKYAASPTATGQICDVTAEIEWHVANGQRKVGGLTQAFYEIAVEPSTGTSAIYAQSENVINRHPE
jgi:hypothetical protein